MTKFPAFLVVAGAAALSIAADAHAGTITVLSSTSWQSIGPEGNKEGLPIGSVGLAWEAANPGWNSSLAYDDGAGAGWHGSVLDGSDGNFPNAYIWSEPSPGNLAATPSYFRSTFVVAGTPTLGLLDFHVDDDALIWLNGNLVVNDANNTATTMFDVLISSFLVSGTNLIAVKAQDSFQFASPGFNFETLAVRLDVTFTAAAVPLPSAAFAGFGLLGAIGALNLRRARLRRRWVR